MKRTSLLLAALGLPVLAVAASYTRPKMELNLKEYDVQMKDFTFPSGLRVIFQEDHSQPIVSITTVFDRGSTADPPGKEGIAHVVEHLWFRSHHKDANGKDLPKVWDLLEEMGANLNASTWDDLTDYMTVVPKQNLVPLLRLEGLRMRNAVQGVTADVLQVEREVIRNELRMRYENGFQAVFGYMNVKLYPQTHPYGRAAYAGIGSHETLNNITIEDCQKFVKDNYIPKNTTMVVVGDFSLNDTPKLLEEIGYDLMVDPQNPDAELKLVAPPTRISGPPTEPPPVVAPAEIKGSVSGVSIERGPVDSPMAVLGWSVPSGWHPNDAIGNFAAFQLQSAITRELYPGWAWEKDDPVESVGCFYQGAVLGSSIMCVIEFKKGEDGVAKVSSALDGLYHVWSQDEIERAYRDWAFSYSKMSYMAQVFQTVDLVSAIGSGRASDLAHFVHQTGDPLYYSRQFEWINQVTPDQVRAYATKYLGRQRAAAVVMMPYEDGDIREDSSDAGYRGARREDRVESILTDAELTPEKIRAAVVPPDVSKLKEYKLDNGLKVVVMPYSDAPLVQMNLVFNGGSESKESGETMFAASSWYNNSNADSLRLAGTDYMWFDDFHSGLAGLASAGNVGDLVFVFRERLNNLVPDTNGRIDWVKSRKKSIITWQKDPAEWASRIMWERLVPGHSLSTWLSHEDYDAMNKWGTTVVSDTFSRFFQPENGTLFVVGNVTPEEVEQAAKTYFGDWTGWGKDPTTTNEQAGYKFQYEDPTVMPTRTVLLFDKQNTSQTDVSYMCPVATVTQDNAAAVSVLSSVLSEEAWLALREETGASYGAGAGVQRFKGGLAFLSMSSLVQNNAAALAVRSFLEIGEEAQAGKLDEGLIKLSKYNLAQSYVLGHQSTEQMLNRLMSIYQMGWGWDYFTKYPDKLANVGLNDLKTIIEPCVGHEVLTLVGPVDVIKPLFEKENIAVEVFDWEKARQEYAAKYGVKISSSDEDKEESSDKKKK